MGQPATEMIIKAVENMAERQGIETLKLMGRHGTRLVPTTWTPGVEDDIDIDEGDEDYEVNEAEEDDQFDEEIEQEEVDELMADKDKDERVE